MGRSGMRYKINDINLYVHLPKVGYIILTKGDYGEVDGFVPPLK